MIQIWVVTPWGYVRRTHFTEEVAAERAQWNTNTIYFIVESISISTE